MDNGWGWQEYWFLPLPQSIIFDHVSESHPARAGPSANHPLPRHKNQPDPAGKTARQAPDLDTYTGNPALKFERSTAPRHFPTMPSGIHGFHKPQRLNSIRDPEPGLAWKAARRRARQIQRRPPEAGSSSSPDHNATRLCPTPQRAHRTTIRGRRQSDRSTPLARPQHHTRIKPVSGSARGTPRPVWFGTEELPAPAL